MRYLEAFILAVVTVFAPAKTALIAALALVFFDFVTGVLAARKRKEKITSAGFKRTVGKIVLYEMALCMAFLAQEFLLGDDVPAFKLISTMIGLVELKSILENLDTINGKPVFRAILKKITQKQAE